MSNMTENLDTIAVNVSKLLAEVPKGTILVAAAKSRTAAEIRAALEAGITYFGHNYIQEAEEIIPSIRTVARWHMIGHLQRNKVNKAIPLFDMIESLDSIRLAKKIDQSCSETGIVMPVLLEINSGRESSKTGLLPKDVPALANS